MASRLRLRPDLPPLRRGRDAVQLGLSATSGGIVLEGLTPADVALLERLDGPPSGALRPPELYAAAAELGVPADRVTELLSLLRRHGVLVDAGPPAEEGARDEPWLVVDGRGPLATAVSSLLRISPAGRVDSGPWAADVADAELREHEERQELCERRGLTDGDVREPPRVALVALVVLVTRGALDPVTGETWRARDVPVLPVLDDGARVLVGPLVTADPAQPCLRCLQLARVDRDARWPEVMAQAAGFTTGGARDTPDRREPPADALSVAAGVVAMVVNLALSDLGGPVAGVSVEVSGPWPRLDHRRWTRHPACPAHDERSAGPSAASSARPSARSGAEHGSPRVTMTG